MLKFTLHPTSCPGLLAYSLFLDFWYLWSGERTRDSFSRYQSIKQEYDGQKKAVAIKIKNSIFKR